MDTWLGVDVGGARQGFDVALVSDGEVLRLDGQLTCAEVVTIVNDAKPVVTAIDSPCRCADDGHTSRQSEREVAKDVCGIRWTPDESRVHASSYYAWIVEGLHLYAALHDAPTEVIEVFPTASWTRWCGKRGGTQRSTWTRAGPHTLGLRGIPKRTNQDQRDAIAAAATARQHSAGATKRFGGDIVVPVATANAPTY